MPICDLCGETDCECDLKGLVNKYDYNCDKCDNKGILSDGKFCDCEVGFTESLMGVSAEVGKLLEED